MVTAFKEGDTVTVIPKHYSIGHGTSPDVRMRITGFTFDRNYYHTAVISGTYVGRLLFEDRELRPSWSISMAI